MKQIEEEKILKFVRFEKTPIPRFEAFGHRILRVFRMKHPKLKYLALDVEFEKDLSFGGFVNFKLVHLWSNQERDQRRIYELPVIILV